MTDRNGMDPGDLDRRITGNYGEDQFKEEEAMTKERIDELRGYAREQRAHGKTGPQTAIDECLNEIERLQAEPGPLTVGEMLNSLTAYAKKFRVDRDVYARNAHMLAITEAPSQEIVDSVLVAFINDIAARCLCDYGLRVSDLQEGAA